jgi:hypothetical protein
MATEREACTPRPLHPDGFNHVAKLPYGLTVDHVRSAMQSFLDFIGFVNVQLHTRRLDRLESFLMPANFSSIVGEFMSANVPKFCPTVAKNTYHNGHPDILPKGKYPSDAALHAPHGIEVKGSRYVKSWQGHNPEDVFLMVFCFDSNRPSDAAKNVPPRPFAFGLVLGAQLKKSDWKFAGRSATSRRTITASVTPSGLEKMQRNWIYTDPNLRDSIAAEE